jgi:hypothetical protein
MATKNIDFNIKVNNKELDLTKISFKQFDDIIKQAKKDLNALPLSDPKYKVLASEIGLAEKAWKAARTEASKFGDDVEQNGDKVKTYGAQIREATKDLIAIEQQFGKNSQQYQDQAQKVKDLRDAQEELTRGTQKLDDALSNIPGPIGQIGQAMQSAEQITQSAKSAFSSLGGSIKGLDGVLKASGIGALVLLVVTLVAALMDAAKKSEPLQMAFAAIGDAVGALFDALKPITDFLINVFVKAVELVSTAINGLASVFGGVNRGFKQQSLALEKELAFQKNVLDNFNTALSANLTERLKIEQDYNTKLKEITDATYKNEADRNRDIALLVLNTSTQKQNLRLKEYQDRKKNLLEINKIEGQALIDGTDNQRRATFMQDYITKKSNLIELELLQQQNRLKLKEIKIQQNVIQKLNVADKDKLLELLRDSYSEELLLSIYYKDLEKNQRAANKADRLKKERQYNREDIAAINDRSNQILQLTTELIKEENARNYKAAQDALIILKEQHRKELEEAQLAGVTLKNLKEKQAAEDKLAREKVRLAKIEMDAYEIQLEIDKQNRLATEAGIGTEEYFNAREEAIQKGFEQEFLLADGNKNKQENARTNQWNSLLQLDKEKLQARIDQLATEYNGMYERTNAFFNKQRDLEQASYELAQKNAQGNYDKLEALALEHQKNLAMIDASELQSKADFEERKGEAIGNIIDANYEHRRMALDERTQAEKIAAGDNAEALEVIQLEYIKKSAELDALAVENKKTILNAQLQLVVSFGSLMQNIGNQLLQAAQGRDKKQFENAKKLAIAGLIIEKAAAIGQIWASNAIANAKSIAASPLTFGQPWVAINTATAALSTAAVIAAAIAQTSAINSTEFQSSDSSSGSAAGGSIANYGKNYEDGGLIGGKRHAQGGTMVEAEAGEAIMTRGAVTMFGPMLSMMNQMGGGVSFAPNALTTSYDSPKTSKPADDKQMIVKTYVVSNELTSEAQRQARLKELSTL